jgi:hypothetical protein
LVGNGDGGVLNLSQLISGDAGVLSQLISGDVGVLNLSQSISWLEKENSRRKRLLCKLKHEHDNNLLSNCK